MTAEYHSKNKYKQNNMREDENRLKGVDTGKFLVRLVLEFGIDNIKKLKVK